MLISSDDLSAFTNYATGRRAGMWVRLTYSQFPGWTHFTLLLKARESSQWGREAGQILHCWKWGAQMTLPAYLWLVIELTCDVIGESRLSIISELLSSAFNISYQFCKTNHATQGFKNKNYLSMNKCCDLCVWGSLRHVTGFYMLLPGILGMQVYQFPYQAFLKGHFLSFKGQMIFEKHLNTSLKDTNENTFQFSLTEIKINLNL